MSAFNTVRFQVKPGRDAAFLAAHRNAKHDWPGFRHGSLIQTGEHRYCFIGEWDDMDALVEARPQMIALLDTFRDTLEDLGGGLGSTDPVSGPAVVELN